MGFLLEYFLLLGKFEELTVVAGNLILNTAKFYRCCFCNGVFDLFGKFLTFAALGIKLRLDFLDLLEKLVSFPFLILYLLFGSLFLVSLFAL